MALSVNLVGPTCRSARTRSSASLPDSRFTNAAVKAAATIRSRTTLDVPKGAETNKVGNTQMEVEIDVPADAAPGTNYFTVISTIGQSAPQPLVMLSADELIEERE